MNGRADLALRDRLARVADKLDCVQNAMCNDWRTRASDGAQKILDEAAEEIRDVVLIMEDGAPKGLSAIRREGEAHD
jgi:hypothetical protein